MIRRGLMNKDDLEILLNTGNFREKPPEYAVRLLEDTCARTGLDWKARHLYLMQRGGKWSVTLSIDGFRLIGSQSAGYAGQEGPFWTLGPDAPWTDIPPEKTPYASKVGIRTAQGNVTWGIAKFVDYKASPMWDKFPSTMVAKCAEMLAWRKAFPGKLGGLYGVEEMAQADKVAAKIADSEGAQGTEWTARLESAKTKDELTKVGKAIAADKTLGVDQMQALHTLYTARKADFATE